MSIIRQKPATWFWLVAIVLTLWGAMGVFAFVADVTMSSADMAKLPAIDQQLYASRPEWMVWAYGVAVTTGLLGSIALLAKRKLATPLFILSLIGVIGSMGWAVFLSNVIALKGPTAAIFPAFIFVIALFQIWFAGYARRRGWLQ